MKLETGHGQGMFSRILFTITLPILCGALPQMAAAQDARAPDPVITRPGGEGNVSRYEFAPEDQPTLHYKAPPAGADTDLFGNEVDILRDQVRELENALMEVRAENRKLKAYNETLLKELGKAD
ncbi:hypothetical protein HW571_28555 [Agrobacterium genomosp. 3]|uniref:hypothetical protein n=1 Tax=Agrobacterium tomkonis TaxID=1183410 RepID=UPI001CD89338|nr:hypothetical protein [Agrobacterium tomkonis]MCA1879889.1 hypothetical protein [Agrobacterium tumefaciens]MCA1895142.1 hypothetical protein [Agrobacterium tomkonis]